MVKTKTDPESNLRKLFGIHKESPVEDESRFVHSSVNSLPIDVLELFPLSGDDDGLCIPASLECRLADGHLLFDCTTLSETSSVDIKKKVRTVFKGHQRARLLKIGPDLLLFHLGVVYIHQSLF